MYCLRPSGCDWEPVASGSSGFGGGEDGRCQPRMCLSLLLPGLRRGVTPFAGVRVAAPGPPLAAAGLVDTTVDAGHPLRPLPLPGPLDVTRSPAARFPRVTCHAGCPDRPRHGGGAGAAPGLEQGGKGLRSRGEDGRISQNFIFPRCACGAQRRLGEHGKNRMRLLAFASRKPSRRRRAQDRAHIWEWGVVPGPVIETALTAAPDDETPVLWKSGDVHVLSPTGVQRVVGLPEAI